MNLDQKYGNASFDTCLQALNTVYDIDSAISVGDLLQYLKARMAAARKEQEEQEKKIIEQLQGKCFKVTYDEANATLIKVDKAEAFVNPSSRDISIDAYLTGEVIEKTDSEICYDKLSKDTEDKYSVYFGKKSYESFPLEKFEKMKKLYFSIHF